METALAVPPVMAAVKPAKLLFEPDYNIKSSVAPTTTRSDSSMSLSSDTSIFESDILGTALHVLTVEQDALANLSHLYRTDDSARSSMTGAITAISKTMQEGGRLIITGVGKSGKIAEKAVATMNSLSIRSSFLHPVEALHGDLGMISLNDIILIISFSGKTPELQAMLPHVPATCTRILLWGQQDPSLSLFNQGGKEDWIFLPAPIPISEASSFGVTAPTTSTTVALALTDALALSVARVLHVDPQKVFKTNHPGGAIGKSL